MSAIIEKEVEYFKKQIEYLKKLKHLIREFSKNEDMAIIIAKDSYLTEDVFSYSPENANILGKFEHLGNMFYLIAFRDKVNIKENYKEINENPVSNNFFRSIEEWEYKIENGIIKKEAKYLHIIDNQPIYTEILFYPRQDKYLYIHKAYKGKNEVDGEGRELFYGEELYGEEALNKIKEKFELYKELTKEESIKEIESMLNLSIRYCQDKIYRLEALDQVIELLKDKHLEIKLYNVKAHPEKILFKIKGTDLIIDVGCFFLQNDELEIDIYENCEKIWSISATVDKNGILKDIWISPNYLNVDATYLSKDEMKQFQPFVSTIYKDTMSVIKKLKSSMVK